MKCPKCGGQTKVTESRLWGNTTLRRRKCLGCGRIFITEELITSAADENYLAWRRTYYAKRRKNQL